MNCNHDPDLAISSNSKSAVIHKNHRTNNALPVFLAHIGNPLICIAKIPQKVICIMIPNPCNIKNQKDFQPLVSGNRVEAIPKCSNPEMKKAQSSPKILAGVDFGSRPVAWANQTPGEVKMKRNSWCQKPLHSPLRPFVSIGEGEPKEVE
jgi:hypothetical protein